MIVLYANQVRVYYIHASMAPKMTLPAASATYSYCHHNVAIAPQLQNKPADTVARKLREAS